MASTVYETTIYFCIDGIEADDVPAVFEIDDTTVQLETTGGPDQYQREIGADLVHCMIGGWKCDRYRLVDILNEEAVRYIEDCVAEEVAS